MAYRYLDTVYDVGENPRLKIRTDIINPIATIIGNEATQYIRSRVYLRIERNVAIPKHRREIERELLKE